MSVLLYAWACVWGERAGPGNILHRDQLQLYWAAGFPHAQTIMFALCNIMTSYNKLEVNKRPLRASRTPPDFFCLLRSHPWVLCVQDSGVMKLFWVHSTGVKLRIRIRIKIRKLIQSVEGYHKYNNTYVWVIMCACMCVHMCVFSSEIQTEGEVYENLRL